APEPVEHSSNAVGIPVIPMIGTGAVPQPERGAVTPDLIGVVAAVTDGTLWAEAADIIAHRSIEIIVVAGAAEDARSLTADRRRILEEASDTIDTTGHRAAGGAGGRVRGV